MRKEVRRDYRETSFPFPEIVVFLIGIAALFVYPLAPSSKQWNDWVYFHFLLVAGIFILSTPVIIFDWPFHPRCSLSYRVNHREIFGKIWPHETYCGRPSIGKVKVVVEKGGKAECRYFCKRCDPEKPHFQNVLKSRYAEVFMRSTIKFWLVERELNEDERKEDSDVDPPDTKIL